VDNPFVSTYVPIYAGVTDVSSLYKTYDFSAYSEDSARWAVDLVEKLMRLRWQSAVKDLREVRDPLEGEFFSSQPEVEKKAAAMLARDAAGAGQFLTDLTVSRMERIVRMYRELKAILLSKYCGDGV
jgi:dipeptidase